MDNKSSHSTQTRRPWHPTRAVGQEQEEKGLSLWWYTLTAPPRVPSDVSYVRREEERKARLLSNVAFFFFLVLLIFLPASFFMPAITPIAVVLAMVSTLIALIFNRAGKTVLGGVIIVLGSEIALGLAILAIRPLRPADIQLYDLYALIILLAVSLLPARYIFLFALAHSIFISVDIITHPLMPALAQDLQTQIIPAIARPVGLQMLSAGVTYIWVTSSMRATERANRAEMVAVLEHAIAEQRAVIEQEKQEMETSIQQLIQAHVAVTKGQSMNQVPYPPAKVLWPLVGAINSLWGRLQSAQQLEREHQQLLQAITNYMGIVQKEARTQKRPLLPLVRTGTSLDQLILAAQAPGDPDTIFES